MSEAVFARVAPVEEIEAISTRGSDLRLFAFTWLAGFVFFLAFIA